MAITWTDIHTREMVKTTHEGLVVAAGHMKVERVMSDIWSEE